MSGEAKRPLTRDATAAQLTQFQPKGSQPRGVQISLAAQHSQESKHAVSPGAHINGSQEPSTQDWQRPQLGTQALGSHW